VFIFSATKQDRDPEYLLMAKIGKYKLWDKSFLSLIIDGSWVSDEVDINSVYRYSVNFVNFLFHRLSLPI